MVQCFGAIISNNKGPKLQVPKRCHINSWKVWAQCTQHLIDIMKRKQDTMSFLLLLKVKMASQQYSLLQA